MVTKRELGVGVKKVMGIKECPRDEHWVTYGTVESQYWTLEMDTILYVSHAGI